MSTEPGSDFISRRAFIATGIGAAICLGGASCSRSRAGFSGGIVGANSAFGHRMRDGGFPKTPTREESVDVVVVGGGIAGLGAARQLLRKGLTDFLLLELEAAPGGNSSHGRNEISAYPWGAHYVPIPNAEADAVVALFEELGLITGRDAAGLPTYLETALCGDPTERLFTCGRWQEGLVPTLGTTAADRAEYESFFKRMDQYRQARGADGLYAFAIPMELSSRDPLWTGLDRISMARWMTDNGWVSKELAWYVDYCCRDDFGAGAAQVSAWAGIHYFAGRRGQASNAGRESVLTWPEGNGWLAQRLAEPLGNRVRSSCVVWRMANTGSGVEVDVFDASRNESFRIRARAAICALPRFIAQRVVEGLPTVPGLEYSPWMVANITLDSLPGGRGVPLCWDNVFRDSRSLGYVVATHQNLDPAPRRTVLTHYWPMDEVEPGPARKGMLGRTYKEWCDMVLGDLERVHAGISGHVRGIDIWLWGHGMVRPTPGFVWGAARQELAKPHGVIHFAHSDMSGLSLFEEAYTRGVAAANAVV